MANYSDFEDAFWAGKITAVQLNERIRDTCVRLTDSVSCVAGLSNVGVVESKHGLLLVDTGDWQRPADTVQILRSYTEAPVRTVVLTHGHRDHTGGLGELDKEARQAGRPVPHVVANRNVPRRLRRYEMTAGYNRLISKRQWTDATMEIPFEVRSADQLIVDRAELDHGATRMVVSHAIGESDDALWGFLPDEGVLFSGDFFTWSFPNAGNPQKAQRYPLEWAETLEEMAAQNPRVLVPGHGPPVTGTERVREVLINTAAALRSLVTQAMDLINHGATEDVVAAALRLPAHYADLPYLTTDYDDIEFVGRNIWRLYAGWYSGYAGDLKPAPRADLGREIVSLAGSVEAVLASARAARDRDELRLAGHLAELAYLADPDHEEAALVYQEVFEQRASRESSRMGRALFRWAAASAAAHRLSIPIAQVLPTARRLSLHE